MTPWCRFTRRPSRDKTPGEKFTQDVDAFLQSGAPQAHSINRKKLAFDTLYFEDLGGNSVVSQPAIELK